MTAQQLEIKTYDPKLDQDYEFYNYLSGTTFSSLKQGFYVLEAVGELNWESYQTILLECIAKTSTTGFVAVSPWHPGAEKLRKKLLSELTSAKEYNGTIFSYFTPTREMLSKLFRIRNEYGGTSSGEWLIGGGSTDLLEKLVICVEWNLSCFLQQADKIECILSLEEMQQSYFFIKPFEGLQSILQEIDQS